MPKPLKEFVQQVLGERNRGTKIRRALDHAAAVLVDEQDNGWWRRKSTRRAIFWENAVNKLIELLADDPGAQVVFHNDTVSFIFDDAVLLRIKKADITLRTSNIQTTTADLFDDHEVDLFGYAGVQRVEAVYIPNQYDSGIVWTGIVAREDGEHLWHCDLPEPAMAPVVPLPAPTPTPTVALAKLKNQNKDRKREDDGGK